MVLKTLTSGVVIRRWIVNGCIQTFWIQPGSRYSLARVLRHLAQERSVGYWSTSNFVNYSFSTCINLIEMFIKQSILLIRHLC